MPALVGGFGKKSSSAYKIQSVLTPYRSGLKLEKIFYFYKSCSLHIAFWKIKISTPLVAYAAPCSNTSSCSVVNFLKIYTKIYKAESSQVLILFRIYKKYTAESRQAFTWYKIIKIYFPTSPESLDPAFKAGAAYALSFPAGEAEPAPYGRIEDSVCTIFLCFNQENKTFNFSADVRPASNLKKNIINKNLFTSTSTSTCIAGQAVVTPAPPALPASANRRWERKSKIIYARSAQAPLAKYNFPSVRTLTTTGAHAGRCAIARRCGGERLINTPAPPNRGQGVELQRLNNINPYYITGLFDAKSSFSIESNYSTEGIKVKTN